ncbi:MAG: NAD-dependent epimerase/dehydratase family protein [Chlamydiae bacterium]|nr:NAD-dependent epimerase/dehydratase family protein [Chlamydiota bacterium]
MIVGILGVGFLGSLIASYLEYEGITPLLISRDKSRVTKWTEEGAQAFLLRPLIKNSWSEMLSQCDALVITVAPGDGSSYEDTYLNTAIMVTRYPLPFYYCSSTSVYGEKNGEPVTEESPLNPLSSSDKTLVETEKVYLRHSSSTLVRIGQLWGFERRIETRLRKPSVFEGNGSMMTNLTHVTDAARAFAFLIKNNYTGIFNVCGNVHKTRKKLYSDLAARYHLSTPLWDPSKKSVHSGNKIVISDKIRSLGFLFKHEDYD